MAPDEMAVYTKRITEEFIEMSVALTEDCNPLHADISDPAVAATREKLGVERAIAHGPMISALACNPIWRLCGSGTIAVEMGPSRYMKPVEIGDEITVVCRVVAQISRRKRKLAISYVNQRREHVIKPTYAIVSVSCV